MRKEIIGCLTGTFVIKPQESGLKTLEGEGTIVIRDEGIVGKNGLIYHQKYGSLYGVFEPTNYTIHAIQEGGYYHGFHKYDVFIKRVQDEVHMGVAVAGESLGARAFRFEFTGSVDFMITDKFGKVSKMFAMGGDSEG